MPSLVTRAAAATLILVLALTVAACGQETGGTTDPESTTESEFAFGSPADAADADRVIEIQTTDALRFEPADLTVAPGETVTFRLTNDGALVHDFTLGDQAIQDEDAEMSEMGGMAHDEPNVTTVPAGETVELTWIFAEEGTVLVGCHQPGHYGAGMTGRITVEG
jgi:uncharacterized cupredoxin-like copper-binding protein